MSTLNTLISQGEHTQQDFKHCINSSKKIAISMVAFANTLGGKLLIGVKDNGKIKGVNPEEELHMIEGASQLYCSPPVQFSTIVHVQDKKKILEVNIPKSLERPHLAKAENGKWLCYLRVDDENILTDPVLMAFWKTEKQKASANKEYTDLDKQVLKHFSKGKFYTYKQIARQIKAPRFKIIQCMAKLMRWQLLEYHVQNQHIIYSESHKF